LSRYRAVAAMMDDPLNRACLMREFFRRQLDQVKVLPPPVPRDGGGWVFPRMREAMAAPTPASYARNDEPSSVYEVYTDGTAWFVYSTDTDEEIGPFDEIPIALKEAKAVAKAAGYEFLERLPWEDQDLQKYPLK